MYKRQHTEIMINNGIHKDWETLPPLKNPDTLMEQSQIHLVFTDEDGNCKRGFFVPKMVRCQEKSLFTKEEYQKMEDERFYSKVDPSITECIEEWESAFQAQEERKRRLADESKTVHL